MLKNVPSNQRPMVDPQVEKEATKGVFSCSVPEPTGHEHDKKISEGWQWCSDGYYFQTQVASREQTCKDITDAFKFQTTNAAPRTVEISVDDLKSLCRSISDNENWYFYRYHDEGDDSYCRYCFKDQPLKSSEYYTERDETKETHKPDCPVLLARALAQLLRQ